MSVPLDAGLSPGKATGAVAPQPAEEGETMRVLPTIIDRDATTLAESESVFGAKSMSAHAEDVSFNLRLSSHPAWRQKRPLISSASDPIEPAHASAAGTVAASRREPARVSLRMVVTVAAVFAFLALASVSAFLLRDHWLTVPKQKTPAAPATVAAFPLQLDVEAQGDGLNVRWNPQSAPVTQAREGRLTILEGDQQPPRVIPLDPQQLTSGHIYYRSSADRLQFQLEIVDGSGGISRESVLALSSRPAVTSFASQAGNGQIPVRRVESIPISSTNTGALTNAAEPASSTQPAPRAFVAPPSSRDRPGQVPAITLDQPPAISTNTALPAAVVVPATLSNLPHNPPAPQAKEPVKEPPKETAAPKQIRVGSLQAANLIRRVTPVYPPTAVSTHIQGIVRFSAIIGKDGTVQNLQLVSGNAALVKAATDAVKQWLYRPALLNGEPVEVITQIDVDFRLNQ